MARVLVSSPLPGSDLPRLSAAHDVEIGPSPQGLGRDGLLARIAGKQAVIVLVTDAIDREILDRAPDLRVVAGFGVGVNHIDLEACRARGVVVTNTPGVLTDATADLTMALLLDACRRVTEGDRDVRAGRWRGWAPTEYLGPRVTGATLGIVGMGRIGQALATRAHAGFSMRIRYAQRARLAPDIEALWSATWMDLDDLLATSEIVCLCVPLTPDTRNLLSADRIARMKPGAVLVNAARGPIVDEAALARALAENRLFAAGLDVYAREPEIHPDLLALPNVVLAPHVGSADLPTREAMARISVDAVLDVLAGKEPKTRVA